MSQQQHQQQQRKRSTSSGNSASAKSSSGSNNKHKNKTYTKNKQPSHYISSKSRQHHGNSGGRNYNNNSNSNNGGGNNRNFRGRSGSHGGSHYSASASLGPSRPLDEYPADKFFGTASLIEQLDKKVMVILQDEQVIVGIFRSFDQFGNFVLQGAHKRFFHEKVFTDVPLGLYIIRGENVELLGEIDEAKDAAGEQGCLRRVTMEEFTTIKTGGAVK